MAIWTEDRINGFVVHQIKTNLDQLQRRATNLARDINELQELVGKFIDLHPESWRASDIGRLWQNFYNEVDNWADVEFGPELSEEMFEKP
jgi:hypothetical protein